jgi:hypothetical protein
MSTGFARGPNESILYNYRQGLMKF